MTERLNHKLDVTKLKTIKDVRNVFDTMELVASMSEDNEKYEMAKEYYTIPYEPQKIVFSNIPRKSLEEIQQELDEKFDELLVKTKRKFSVSQQSAEYHYNQKFNRIIENFEYARENLAFPQKLTLSKTGLDYSKLSASSSLNWTNSIGNGNAGYWSIQPSFRVYLDKKPSAIVRYFTKKLLNFTWVDGK